MSCVAGRRVAGATWRRAVERGSARTNRPGRQSAGIVGVGLIVASLAVLEAVGIHASRLGADPRWAFDCDDTTCEQLWAEAR